MIIETQPIEELKEVASGLHGVINVRLSRHLANFIEDNKLGYVLDSSTTYNFGENQPKRQPDVSFVSLEKMPRPPDEEVTAVPELVVEVVSKNDTAYEIAKKVMQYQEAGVRLIWVVYPVNQTIAVYRVNSGPLSEIIGIQGELDGEDVIPGFKLKVNKLFE